MLFLSLEQQYGPSWRPLFTGGKRDTGGPSSWSVLSYSAALILLVGQQEEVLVCKSSKLNKW